MHSGGGQKLQWSDIYIEAAEERAREVFEERFDRDPGYVTCECCGPDYSGIEDETLEEATRFRRRDKGDVVPLDQYLKYPNVLVIRASEFK